uniref:Uncharacterized protein n=1 Tax=Oryza nivara TaxID=4536 RepID=A0A0E0HY07_ORYNI
MRIRGTITLPSSKKGQMRMFVLAQKRRQYWIHWCTTKISLPFVNWMETMKTAKRNAWQGGAQKNPAAKEMPGNCFCERRTMARTADPSE